MRYYTTTYKKMILVPDEDKITNDLITLLQNFESAGFKMKESSKFYFKVQKWVGLEVKLGSAEQIKKILPIRKYDYHYDKHLELYTLTYGQVQFMR